MMRKRLFPKLYFVNEVSESRCTRAFREVGIPDSTRKASWAFTLKHRIYDTGIHCLETNLWSVSFKSHSLHTCTVGTT